MGGVSLVSGDSQLDLKGPCPCMSEPLWQGPSQVCVAPAPTWEAEVPYFSCFRGLTATSWSGQLEEGFVPGQWLQWACHHIYHSSQVMSLPTWALLDHRKTLDSVGLPSLTCNPHWLHQTWFLGELQVSADWSCSPAVFLSPELDLAPA